MNRSTVDLQVISLDLLFATGQFVRRLHHESAANELSWTQLAIMARLASQGPTTIADLARAEMLRPQTMGSAVSCLEELGIAGRRAHPSDGRQDLFGLTLAGIETRAAAASLRLAWLTDAMTGGDQINTCTEWSKARRNKPGRVRRRRQITQESSATALAPNSKEVSHG